ncbi:substrate-binding periplasmic protein [Bdellovibrio sp. GT3]|uniref:substrate-binding periplasmic protein n=1 Tax=Bdellovibrio sp. GT3 TaxID=3136282 RepID=UPI0030EFCA53
MKLVPLVGSLVFSSMAAMANTGALNTVVPDGMAAPLLNEQKSGEVEGIIADYNRALFRILKRDGNVSVMTRYRLQEYLLNGKVDYICYASKVWVEDTEKFIWTKPLFTKREVLLGPTPMPKDPKKLKGKTIGTILGYVYPKLDPLFQSKWLQREDASSEFSNLNKLRYGRVKYVVTDEIFIEYYNFLNKDQSLDEGRQRIPLQKYDVSCLISRKSSLTVQELNRAISKLKSSGELKKIFKKYGVDLH